MAHIIVLDVNESRQTWYSTALEGHVVSFVDRPVEAAYAARAFPTDLIIAEWFDSSGKEVLEELDRLPDLRKPPVVLTADLRVPLAVRDAATVAKKYGAVGFIPQPIAHDQFRSFVQALLASKMPETIGTLQIRVATPAPSTVDDCVLLLYHVRQVKLLIDQTIGWGACHGFLKMAIESESLDAAQQACGVIVEWSRDELPLVRAADISARYGRQLRTPSQDLLFLIAQAMLFPNRVF